MKGQFPLAFGGEHLMAFPLVMAAYESNPDLAVVPFDAHSAHHRKR